MVGIQRAEDDTVTPWSRSKHDWVLFALLLGAVLGVGLLVSSVVVSPSASSWTASLVLPEFYIPEPWDGLVSLVLGVAYAFVGWRVMLRGDHYAAATWWAVLILSWLFTPMFIAFRAYYPALAIIVIVAVLLVILTARLLRTDWLLAVLTAPSAFYVIYAAVLTFAVIDLNDL